MSETAIAASHLLTALIGQIHVFILLLVVFILALVRMRLHRSVSILVLVFVALELVALVGGTWNSVVLAPQLVSSGHEWKEAIRITTFVAIFFSLMSTVGMALLAWAAFGWRRTFPSLVYPANPPPGPPPMPQKPVA